MSYSKTPRKPILEATKGDFLVFNVSTRGVPTVVHPSKTKAINEAKRLSRLNPNNKFLICEVVSFKFNTLVKHEVKLTLSDEELKELPSIVVDQLSKELQTRWYNLQIG